MVQVPSFILTFVLAVTQAAPLQKRIAQTISASTVQWEQACLAADGGQRCNPLSVAAFSALLAAPGPCDQQNAADDMIDLAKTLSNNSEVIHLTQIFTQQPRNTPTSQSVPYCQQAPKNAELNGLFQCQFAGASPTVFVGGVPVGQQGTIPFGLKVPLKPAGSCPAHPDGPIADGSQLIDITQNPRAGGAGNSTTLSSTVPSPSKSIASSTASPPASTSSNATTRAPPAQSGGGFQLQNGKDAQALNARFAALNPNSACQSGQEACIDNSFAECVNGTFVTSTCAPSLSCFALPLVNKPGTSIACTTEVDATSRIAGTGATGGISGS